MEDEGHTIPGGSMWQLGSMNFLSDGWKATLANINGCDIVEYHFL
jgi:hypothetical protein